MVGFCLPGIIIIAIVVVILIIINVLVFHYQHCNHHHLCLKALWHDNIHPKYITGMALLNHIRPISKTSTSATSHILRFSITGYILSRRV